MCPPDRLAGAQFAVYTRRMPWYIIAPTINSKTNFDFVPRAKRAEDKRPSPLPRLALPAVPLGPAWTLFSNFFPYLELVFRVYIYIYKRLVGIPGYSRDDSFPISGRFGFWKNSRKRKGGGGGGEREREAAGAVLSEALIIEVSKWRDSDVLPYKWHHISGQVSPVCRVAPAWCMDDGILARPPIRYVTPIGSDSCAYIAFPIVLRPSPPLRYIGSRNLDD